MAKRKLKPSELKLWKGESPYQYYVRKFERTVESMRERGIEPRSTEMYSNTEFWYIRAAMIGTYVDDYREGRVKTKYLTNAQLEKFDSLRDDSNRDIEQVKLYGSVTRKFKKYIDDKIVERQVYQTTLRSAAATKKAVIGAGRARKAQLKAELEYLESTQDEPSSDYNDRVTKLKEELETTSRRIKEAAKTKVEQIRANRSAVDWTDVLDRYHELVNSGETPKEASRIAYKKSIIYAGGEY